MKAYLIDPVQKAVTEVEHDESNSLASIYKHTRCDCIDLVHIDRHDAIYVDDNGLLNGIPFGMFVLTGTHRAAPLAGYGLVLGVNNMGETVAPRITLDELRAMVTFPSVDEIRQRARQGEFD